jgi:hypothetical protein
MHRYFMQAAGVLVLSSAFTVNLSSCGGKKEEGNKSDTAKTDGAAVYKMSPETEALAAKFPESNAFPFVADTVLAGRKMTDSLNTAEVKLLAAKWFSHDLVREAGYSLDEFYKIDSVKATGTYAKWCDELEIGNTKYSDVYPVNKLKLNNETWVLIWEHKSASYEACPYFSSTDFYFTIVYKGVIGESFRLAEFMSAGDPPVSTMRHVTGKLYQDGKVEINVDEVNDEDMDAPEVESVKQQYVFAIADGKVAMKMEKKDEPKMIKRPKEN